MHVVEEMKSLPNYRVLKATDVVLTGKKEIDVEPEKTINFLEEDEKNRDIIQGENFYLSENEDGKGSEIAPEDLLASAEIQYEEILRKANEEAEAIVKESYNESKLIFEKTEKEAYKMGFEKGKERGYEEVENFISETVIIKREIQNEKKEMGVKLKGELIQLVLETVEEVLLHELNEDNELMLHLIEKGIKHCTFTEVLTIRVSEMDVDYVESSKNKIFLMTEGVERLDIKVDKSLPQGSVVIETPAGIVDSSLETQIDIIRKAFMDLLKSE